MSDDLKPKILEWLKKQGYPLEMEVARTFRHAGFEVSSSEYYVDPEEQKPREIDVLASMSTTIEGMLFQITYVVECKSSKESPWICFQPDTPARDRSVGFLARIATREGRRALVELSVNPDITTQELLALPERHAYGLTNALKDSNKDVPFAALRATRSAATALVSYSDSVQSPLKRIDFVCIALPLVVTTAPLFTVSLDSTGEPELSATNHETILHTGFDTDSVIEVVALHKLKDYAAKRAELIGRFLRRLPGRIPTTLQELGYANLAADDGE